jgi:hypothetical protein
MPDNRDLDQPDRPNDSLLEDDEEIVGLEDDSEDDEFEDVEDENMEEEARGQEFADIVGDEGGSSGERPPS